MFVTYILRWALCALICTQFAHAVANVHDVPFVTVPLRRRDAVSKRASFDTLAAMAHNLRQKYNYTSTSYVGRRQGSGVVPIIDQNADSSYSGQISIGGQSFGVILDTGSSDLWVASTSCNRGCTGVPTYNPSSSRSFANQNQQVSITYGSGAVRGTVGTDTVSMGGFTLSQTFLAAEQVSSDLLDDTLSGLLGLGFKAIASTGATPFVQALTLGNFFSSPLMSVYLARFIDNPSASSSEPGGILTLGATNSSFFQGDIDFVDIPSAVTPGFWLLPVTGITVEGSTLSVPTSSSRSSSQLAAIDTGTTLIGGPSDAVAALYAKIPGSQAGAGQTQGYYTYPCGTKVNVAMTFGGKNSWPINPSDFQLQAQDRDGSPVCVGAVFDLQAGSSPTTGAGPPRKRQATNSNNPDWIVGDSFLKNVYTVFRYDPPSVGFAQLSSSVAGAGSPPGPAVSGGLNSGNSTSSSKGLTTAAISSSADALPSSIVPPSRNSADHLAANLASAFVLSGAVAALFRLRL